VKLALYYPWLEGPGGVPAYCRLLCDALAREGIATDTLCEAGPNRSDEPLVSAYHPSRRWPPMLSAIALLRRYLRTHASSIDALVMIGGFSPYNAVAALLARRSGVPYVVSPEGTISREVLGSGRRRLKQLYWHLVERHILAHAAAIRILSDFEERFLTELGVRTPMFLAREGPDADAVTAARSYARRRVRAQQFLFLGRLDIWHKGLDRLLMGFAASLREGDRGQRLSLVGPPESGALPHLRELCDHLRLTVGREVGILPAVRGPAKWETFKNADVFVHPSRKEGIPRSVVEALVMGLPVVVTQETNLTTIVEQAGAGWSVPSSAEGVGLGFQQALGCRDFSERCEAASRLAQAKLMWNTIAADFAQGARAALNGRRPGS
jgi:glycosyltransferase involved in cell wall biosynthesis